MKSVAFLLALLALPAAAPATPEPVASAQVVHDGDIWTVDYRLDVKAPAWVFARSALPRVKRQSWRIDSMQVLTPGVTLERIGHYDVLVAARGNVPARVRLRFKPFEKDLESDYDPALVFTDGSVALYSQHFKVAPMGSLDEVRAAPIDSSELPSVIHPTRVSFRDKGGRVLARGNRQDVFTTGDEESYVLFGKAVPVTGAALTTIIDPGLPEWLRDFIVADMPRLLAGYAEKLGPPPTGKPMLMASWSGPTKGVTSMGGSVLTGTVVMAFEGEGVLQPSSAALNAARWFVAHESAHFWLGQVVAYEGPQESWITEGGADLLAIRAVAAIDPEYNAAKRLAEAHDECLPFLAKGGVASANQRGDHRAYYSCGAIIGLAAEQASGGDFAGFVKALIDRHGQDGIVTRAEWLGLLEERSPGMAAEVSKLLDAAPGGPASALDDFIARAGIGHAMQVKQVTR